MKKKLVVLAVVIVLIAAFAWWWTHRARPAGELTLYGTVDLRQVELAFNNSERIEAVLVEEGARVTPGQVLARVETSRLAPLAAQTRAQAAAAAQTVARLRHGARPEEIAQAEAQFNAQQQVVDKLRHGSRPEEIAAAAAQVAAQQQGVDKLHRGSRPEEIAQAEAGATAADAAALLARQTYERTDALYQSSDGKAVSRQEDDAARAARDNAAAQLTVATKQLELARLGPRAEDIAAAEAQLTAAKQALLLAQAGPRKEDIAEAEQRLVVLQKNLELVRLGPRAEDIAEAEARQAAAAAQAALSDKQLADAQLIAPTAGVVRTRILEPGEMASPQKPVLSLAVTDVKWIRAYIDESDVSRIKEGLAATVTVDGLPDQPFTGWVGFISPVAEFTPKSIQTEELRTSLVYEVRVYVSDPQDQLRLGMPATVQLHEGQMAPAPVPPAAPAPPPPPAPAAATPPVRQP